MLYFILNYVISPHPDSAAWLNPSTQGLAKVFRTQQVFFVSYWHSFPFILIDSDQNLVHRFTDGLLRTCTANCTPLQSWQSVTGLKTQQPKLSNEIDDIDLLLSIHDLTTFLFFLLLLNPECRTHCAVRQMGEKKKKFPSVQYVDQQKKDMILYQNCNDGGKKSKIFWFSLIVLELTVVFFLGAKKKSF